MLEVIKKFKWVIIGFATLILIGVVILILNNNHVFNPIPPEPEDTTDFTFDEEELNENLSSLISKDPNVNYISESEQTRFTSVSPSYFYDTTEPWWKVGDSSAKNGAAITSFATAISTLSDRYLPPSAIAYITEKQEIWDLYGKAPDNLFRKLADYYGLFYREVPAMNSNILNYYLDQDAVVIIYGKGKEPYTSDGNYLVILAGYPDSASYLVSSPTNAHYRNNLATRYEVLTNLESDEKFYVLSGITSRPDFSAYIEDFNYQGKKQ